MLLPALLRPTLSKLGGEGREAGRTWRALRMPKATLLSYRVWYAAIVIRISSRTCPSRAPRDRLHGCRVDCESMYRKEASLILTHPQEEETALSAVDGDLADELIEGL